MVNWRKKTESLWTSYVKFRFQPKGMSEFKIEPNHLHPIMSECRVIKTEMELQALRYASKISSEAHKSLMRQIKPGMKVSAIKADNEVDSG